MASLVEQRFVEEILTSEGARLLKNQEAAFTARLNFHSKNIVARREAEVSAGGDYSGEQGSFRRIESIEGDKPAKAGV